MEKEIKIWYDKEGDFLEVMFEKKTVIFGKQMMMQ